MCVGLENVLLSISVSQNIVKTSYHKWHKLPLCCVQNVVAFVLC